MHNTLIDSLRVCIEANPDKLALTYLEDGWRPTDSLTFLELDQKAKVIASVLGNRFPKKERILLVYPEGVEFLPAYLGCVYAGMVAVPVPFPDAIRLKRTLPRIQAILEDVQAHVILSVARFNSEVESYFGLPLLATDTLPHVTGESWQPATALPDDLIHLQYTSGSITTPKGVMVSHRNLIQNIADTDEVWPYTPESVSLVWMPHVHDFGLVEGLLRPFLAGIPNNVISPTAFIKRPIRWLQAITKYRISHTGGANFAFEYCVDRTTSDERRDLDLSCWKVAAVGAEPVRPQTLIQFSETFAPFGFQEVTFCQGYGLAEATMLLSAKARGIRTRYKTFDFGKNQKSFLTACGRAHGTSNILIVDPEKRVTLSDGQVGEIWATGPNITQGYWNKPEETQKVFQAYLENTDEGPFLRTGDLGLIQDGDLFITGRLKDMFILHGQNYYPQDIEWAIEDCHRALHGCRGAVFTFEKDGQEKIVVVQELIRRGTPDEEFPVIARAIQETVGSDFELPLHSIILVRRGDLPKTASGKIRRQACREALLEGSLHGIFTWKDDQVAERQESKPLDDMTRAVLQIWQELLKRQDIGVNDNFFALGGDSLTALRLTLLVEEKFSKPIRPLFFTDPTVTRLVAGLKEEGATGLPGQLPVHLSEYKHSDEQPRKILRNQKGFKFIYSIFNQSIYLVCGTKIFQTLIFPGMTASLKQFYREIRPGIPEKDHIHLALFSSVSRFLRQRFFYKATKEQFLDYVHINGWEIMQQALELKKGVILVALHTCVSNLTPLVILNRIDQPLFVIQKGPGVRAAKRIWVKKIMKRLSLDVDSRVQQLLYANTVLANHGIVLIAGDGQQGKSQGVRLPFFKRSREFKIGFAELALLSDAVLIPTVSSLNPDGNIEVEFLNPLDKGDPSLQREERIMGMVRQFVKIMKAHWINNPLSIGIKQIAPYLQMPYLEVAEENPSTQDNGSEIRPAQ